MSTLTPEQIASIRAEAGVAPLTASQPQLKSLSERIGITSDQVERPGLLKRISKDIKDRGVKVEENISGTAPESQGEGGLVRGLQAAGNTAGAVTDTAGEVLSSLYHTLVAPKYQELISKAGDKVGEVKDTIENSDTFAKIGQHINDWAEKHPEAAKNLTSTLKGLSATGEVANVPLIAEGAAKTGTVATDIAKQAPETITKTIDNIKISKNASKLSRAEKDAIEAVNPDLTGKKLAGAYEEVVTGNRTISPSGILKEQSLSPSERAINTGKRLSSDIELSDGSLNKSIKLGKDHIKNLENLKTALNDTEEQLNKALVKDPNIKLNKETLQSSLDDIKTNAPREFTAIKDNRAVYDKVVDFAKEKIAEAEDTIKGGREARSLFDAQSKKEFPSAFTEGGVIDTKTPAGRAIKAARDTINEHLYNTAPNGSDIQSLVGREADIFNATESIAPKVSASHGYTKLEKIKKTIKEHPVKSAAGALLIDKALKKTTGIGI